MNVDATQIIKGAMGLRELFDRDAAAEHREAETAVFFGRVAAEQSHPAQARHRAFRYLAGRLDRAIVGLQLAADELAHPALQGDEIVGKLEVHGTTKTRIIFEKCCAAVMAM